MTFKKGQDGNRINIITTLHGIVRQVCAPGQSHYHLADVSKLNIISNQHGQEVINCLV